jgi:hypothetical protein
MSVLAAAEAQLPLVKGEDGQIMTQQFLSVCKLVFPVIGEKRKHRARVSPAPARRRRRRQAAPSLTSSAHQNHTQTDKLGAAFSIVKMDIGGNIDVRRGVRCCSETVFGGGPRPPPARAGAFDAHDSTTPPPLPPKKPNPNSASTPAS